MPLQASNEPFDSPTFGAMAGLHSVAGGADRIAVVDTETTGVYNSDRVVEVAILTLTLDGEVVDEWETLVQPGRDISASHIHGITASMVADAPRFEDVAGDIAVRLHGACVAAHNLPFDSRMIRNEFERFGSSVTIDCGIDTLRATGLRLSEACAEYGIDISQAHRALDDASALASLLSATGHLCDPGGAAAMPTGLLRSGRVLRRSDTAPALLPDPPLISYLASRLRFVGADAAVVAYLDLLGTAVSDLHLDSAERTGLADFAAQYGLSADLLRQAHRRFVNELADAALADHVVTDDEYDALLRVASALEVDQSVVEDRVRVARSGASEVRLDAGMAIVVTGEHGAMPRSEIEDMLTGEGFVVKKNTSRKVDLVAAADPMSQSGKAAKARELGIPITSINELVRALAENRAVSVTSAAHQLVVVTCPDCWATWTVPAERGVETAQRCDACAALTAGSEGWAPPTADTAAG